MSNSYWSVIVPASTINYITNPSFEGQTSSTRLTGWNGGSRLSSIATQNVYGNIAALSTYKKEQSGSVILISASNAAVTLQTSSSYVFSAHVHSSSAWGGSTIFVGASDFTGASVDRKVTYDSGDRGKWKRIYSVVTTGSDTTGLLHVSFDTAPTDSQDVYIDGVMIETGSRISTYVDGDQEGCIWQGYARRSTSKRLPDDPRGGYKYSFANDLSIPIGTQVGMGATTPINQFQKQALSDGVLYQGTKLGERNNFVLAGTFDEQDTRAGFHTRRAGLIRALNARTKNIVDGPAPRRLVYSGATTEKYVDAVYAGGLELNDTQAFTEDIAIKFQTPDPMFYEITNNSSPMDYSDSSTVTGVAAKISGFWSNGGASTMSFLSLVDAIASDDEYVYVGGNFTGLNGGSINHLFRYNYRTGQISNMGGNPSLQVRSIFVAPNGDVYIGGNFQSVNGVSASGVAKWDGTTWSSVGSALSGGTVYDIAMQSNGTLWVVGSFSNWNSNGALDYIARWDGAAWSGIGATNNNVYSIDIDKNDNVYLGGEFTTIGGTTAGRLAKWTTTASITAMGDGPNGAVHAVKVAADGSLYVGGEFTVVDSNSFPYIAKWNGVAFERIGSQNLNSFVYDLDLDQKTGNVLVGGAFTQIGNSTLLDRIALFNGSVWSHLDVDLPGTPTVSAVHITRLRDMWFGFTTAGTATHSAGTNVSYEGTEYGYPVIIVDNSLNNASARITNIENITTGAVIYMDYTVAPGDIVTIDFRPGSRGVTSRFRGDITNSFAPNSDIAKFVLMPSNRDVANNNVIKMLITGATPTTYIQWKNVYNGVDD